MSSKLVRKHTCYINTYMHIHNTLRNGTSLILLRDGVAKQCGHRNITFLTPSQNPDLNSQQHFIPMFTEGIHSHVQGWDEDRKQGPNVLWHPRPQGWEHTRHFHLPPSTLWCLLMDRRLWVRDCSHLPNPWGEQVLGGHVLEDKDLGHLAPSPR